MKPCKHPKGNSECSIEAYTKNWQKPGIHPREMRCKCSDRWRKKPKIFLVLGTSMLLFIMGSQILKSSPDTLGGVNLNNASYENRYHVITMLSLYCGHIWPGYEDFTIDRLNERDKEYLATLESNINHPLVERVHLFYNNEEALQVIGQQKWVNYEKILPVKIDRLTHMMDFFSYASKHLLDKPVIALNGDIVIGEGFDVIDTERMRDERILFSLTRHGSESLNCTQENYCTNGKYQGSHDTHIFRLREPLDEKILLKLDYPINMWQAENGMIGVMRKFFKFSVLNPCRVLKTYHHHCSGVHNHKKVYSIKEPPYDWSYRLIGISTPVDGLVYDYSSNLLVNIYDNFLFNLLPF